MDSLSEEGKQALKTALLDLKRLGFKEALMEEALGVSFKTDADLNSYALERAWIEGFNSCIKFIFEGETINGR